MSVSNLDEILDTDLLACTDNDGVTKKVTGAQFKELFVDTFVTVNNIAGTKHSDCSGKGVYVAGEQLSAVLTVSGSSTSTTKVEWVEKKTMGRETVHATGQTITIPEEFVGKNITVRATISDGGIEKDSHELENALVEGDTELIVVTDLEGVLWKYPNSGNFSRKDVRFVCSNYKYQGSAKYKPLTDDRGVEIRNAQGTGNVITHCYYSGTGPREVASCDFHSTPYVMVRFAFSEDGNPVNKISYSNWNCLILPSSDFKQDGIDGAVPKEFI